MAAFRIDVDDVAELGELCLFLRNWLAGADQDLLADSYNRFVGQPDWPVNDLKLDLERFAFLLGAIDELQPPYPDGLR